jgi:hypothetical protein
VPARNLGKLARSKQLQHFFDFASTFVLLSERKPNLVRLGASRVTLGESMECSRTIASVKSGNTPIEMPGFFLFAVKLGGIELPQFLLQQVNPVFAEEPRHSVFDRFTSAREK